MIVNEKKIAIGSDHAGYELKAKLKEILQSEKYEVEDFGTFSADSVDYPDVAHPLAMAIEKNKFAKGILICGTGNGVNMTANKHQGIRAALCWSEKIAAYARQHNDANILSLPARFIRYDEAKNIMNVFLNTNFEGGRHLIRINKIDI